MADLSASLGMPLDEWQEYALEAAMGERADGRWVSKYVGISAPRQNGKSQIIVARALAGVLLFGEKKIIISAHETDTAREVWKRLIDVIEANPSLEKRLTGRMDAINREYVQLGTGMDRQEIKLKARRTSGTRGFSADCLLLDEAQILGKRAWGSINPTMSAMPNPQLWLFGTPPTGDDDSFAFSRTRESSLRKAPRHTWLEWAAEPKDDLDDPATWAKANPAYGVRISHEACADDRVAMDDEQFAMERLGMWAELVVGQKVFDPSDWAACSRSGRPAGLALGAFGVATDMDLTHSTIVGAGALEGEQWVKPLQHGPGTGWLVDRCVELQSQHYAPVVIDGRGPAAVFIPHLERAGVQVDVATTTNYLDACAGFDAAVREQTLRHVESAELNAAVDAAKRRDVGERWAWGRRKSEANIAPLEAATLAVWSLQGDGAAVPDYEAHGVMSI